MAVETLVLVAGAVALVAVLLVRAALSYAEFRRLELAIPGPPSLPILGNALTVATATRKTILPTILRMIDNRREMMRISIFNNLIVTVSDPDDIADVMKRKEFDHKSKFFYNLIGFICPNGLVQLSGPLWKEHRKMLQPAVALDVIEPYMHVFAEEAELFAEKLPRGERVEVFDALNLPMVRMFVRTGMLADNLDESHDAILAEAVHLLEDTLESVNTRSFAPWLWSDKVFALTSMGRALKRRAAVVREFITANIVKQRQQARLDAQEAECEGLAARRKQILIDKMLQCGMSDQDMMDEIFTFLSAATDPNVSTLAYFFKLMSMYPDVQDRVHAELADVLGSGPDRRPVDLHDLPKLQYVEQTIKETMRICTIVPFLGRQVHEKTVIAGKTVPADSTLIVNVFGAHHDPKHWPEPWKFDPERFAPGKEADRHPYCFLPFSAGKRNCLGSRYAMMTMKALVAAVIGRHRVDPVDDGLKEPRDFTQTFNLTSRIYGGTWIKFSPRTAVTAG